MPNDTGTEAAKSEEVVVEGQLGSQETQAEIDYKAKAAELEAQLKEEAGRRKRAEAKLERDRINNAVEDKVEKVLSKKDPSELDQTDVLRLEMKGIEADDEVELVKQWKKDTGRDLKAILANKLFQSELQDLRQEKTNKAATPTSVKRGSAGATDNEDFYFAKYEQTGELPKNISREMQVRLVNRKAAQSDPRRSPFE